MNLAENYKGLHIYTLGTKPSTDKAEPVVETEVKPMDLNAPTLKRLSFDSDK